MRGTGVVAQPIIEFELGTGGMESDLLNYLRWLYMKLLDRVLEALLRPADAL